MLQKMFIGMILHEIEEITLSCLGIPINSEYTDAILSNILADFEKGIDEMKLGSLMAVFAMAVEIRKLNLTSAQYLKRGLGW